jgi:hypothetical protein
MMFTFQPRIRELLLIVIGSPDDGAFGRPSVRLPFSAQRYP